jgi:hypothetical protein
MLRSFLSALAGWVSAIVALPVAGFLNARTIDVLSWDIILVSASYGAVFVFPVWLFVLWPLYGRVPFRSVLWRPYVCIPCGAIAGGLLIWLPFPFLVRLPFHPHPYFYVGPFVGAVTCAVGCAIKYREDLVSFLPKRRFRCNT